jgi:TPR repeat protein
MIKSFLLRSVPTLTLACVLASAAYAGPLEDGVKAYTKADYSTAVRLLKPLAESGNTDAQYLMAGMYAKGQGVPEDKVRAYVMYDKAAQGGDPDAGADRDKLLSEMKPDQVEEAKRQAAGH